jgi:alpha-methylacyl-CoA racemase
MELDGVVQPAPTPRFSRTSPRVSKPPPEFGADSLEALQDWGVSEQIVNQLLTGDVIGWAEDQ